jgi:hypothetical protein
MGHSIGDMRYKRTLAIAALLLVSALIAVYGFNVSWGTLAPLAFLAFFVWMHAGGHGMHGGGHGGQGDDPHRDEHAGHTPTPESDSNARALAPDTDARPLASGTDATSVAREAPRRRGGC